MRPRTEARFAVGSREGPRSMIWKVWVHGDEAYIASRAFGKYQKVSLHSSGIAQWSLTDDWVKEQPTRRNADRHIVKWTMPAATQKKAALVFKVQIPCSELRQLPTPEDKKKVFWVSSVPSETTVRFLFYMTDVHDGDPTPQDSNTRRVLFSLRLRSGRWLVSMLDAVTLSSADLSNARRAVIDQFVPRAAQLDLNEMRAALFCQPNESEVDCHGLIELCLAEA